MSKLKNFKFISVPLISIMVFLLLICSGKNVSAVNTSGIVSYTVDGVEQTVEYGTEVSLVASVKEGEEFLFWTENGKLISKSSSYVVTIFGEQNFVSVYKSSDSIVIVFLDSNNDYLGISDIDPIVYPTDPTKPGYIFSSWDMPDTITEDTYVYATYTKKIDYVEISNGASSLSYLLDNNKLALIGKATSLNEIIEFGVVTSTIGDPNENTGTTQKRAAIATENNEYSIIINIPNGTTIYTRSYVVVDNGTSLVVEYSDLATVINHYNISYDLDGGTWQYNSKDEMITDFISDYNTFCSLATTPSTFYSTAGNNFIANKGFFKNEANYKKWGWMLSYMSTKAGVNPKKAIDDIINYRTCSAEFYIRQEIHGFLTNSKNAEYSSFNPSADYSKINPQEFWFYLKPIKPDLVFSGWVNVQNNENVTSIPLSNINLKATWSNAVATATLNWEYSTKTDEVNSFLFDFYTWLGSKSIIDTASMSFSQFSGKDKAGTGNDSKYIGEWFKYIGLPGNSLGASYIDSSYYGSNSTNYLRKIGTGTTTSTIIDENFFMNSSMYHDKWAQYGNYIHDYVGKSHRFWDQSYGTYELTRYITEINANSTTLAIITGHKGSFEMVIIYTPESSSSLPVITKFGSTFVSWNTSVDGTGTTYTGLPINSPVDLSLYAIWN